MPHIHAYFPEDLAVRTFLKENKRTICLIFARQSGYTPGEIALYPHPIKPEDMELAENVLPLEFVIHSGSRTQSETTIRTCARNFKARLLDECPGATDIHFGVWLRPLVLNEYAEYKPRR